MGRKQIIGKPKVEHPAGRAFTPQEVHSMGVASSRQFNPHQMELPGMTGEGVERPKTQPLRRWEDMAPEERSGVEQHLKSTYGITMRNAVHNHGVLIDRSIAERGGQGQHFYQGGGDDEHSYVGHGQIAQASREHGLPFHVVAAMRGVLSPRSNVHDEIYNLHRVVEHVRANPAAAYDSEVPGVVGMNGPRNSKKAAEIMRQHLAGTHPLEARDPRNPKKPLIDPASNPKVLSYIQSYTHPDDPATRTAVDTHAVGGMAPHLPKSAPRQGTGKFDRKGKEFTTPVGQGHPSWTPNQEDALNRRGAYEFFDYAQRTAAHKRGLTGPEAQSMAWHVERERGGNVQPGTGNAASRRRGAAQPTLGL